MDGHLPASNHDYWAEKIARNKERDQRNKEKLVQMGWGVMTIWECQLKPAVREKTLFEMEYWINHSYLDRLRKKAAKPYAVADESLPMAAESEAGYGSSDPLDVVEQADD